MGRENRADRIEWLAVPILQQMTRLLPWNLLRTLDEVRQLPALRTQIDQFQAVYRSDARPTRRLDKGLSKIQQPRACEHVRDVVAAAPLEPDPCPHVVVEGLLPDEVYDELVAAIPPPVFFDHLEEDLKLPFEFAPRYHQEIWKAFQTHIVTGGLEPALGEKFRDGLDRLIREYWPDLRSMADGGIHLHRFNTRIMRRRSGYEIKPHRDPRWAFLTCILYLTRRDDTQTYGTQLCRLRREREAPSPSPFYADDSECEVVREIPGRPNTAVVFLNSTGMHRASIPPDAPPNTDRYIYQLQLGPERKVREALVDRLPAEHVPRWSTTRPN